MQTQSVPFIGGSYEYRSRGISTQRTLNLIPENIENGEGKVNMSLVYTPGEQLVATIGDDPNAPCRGFWYSSTGPDARSLLYGAYGNKIYRINPDFSYIEIGTIASGTGPIGIAENGFNGVVADGVTLYQFDLNADDFTVSATWQQVDMPELPGGNGEPVRPSQCFFLNQRIIINSQANVFYFSELPQPDNVIKFEQLNFYSAESSADAINSMQVISNRLYIMGERSYEVWSASGTSDTDPLSYVQGSSSQIGNQSPRSLSSIGETTFFLGSSDAGINTVFMISGLNYPKRISNNALENTFNEIDDPQGAIGWCHYYEGHTLYVLTFQNAKRTFVYDLSTNLWHERSTRDWTTTEDLAWEPVFGVTAYNKVYHGGVTGNNLILLDQNKYTDYNDQPVIRRRVGPVYYSDFNPITMRELYVDMEVGTTPLLSGLGRDPQAVLEISRDGGNTWINFDWRSIGSQGDYTQSVKWSNLGTGRAVIARLTFSDPSPITLYGMRIAFEESSRR